LGAFEDGGATVVDIPPGRGVVPATWAGIELGYPGLTPAGMLVGLPTTWAGDPAMPGIVVGGRADTGEPEGTAPDETRGCPGGGAELTGVESGTG